VTLMLQVVQRVIADHPLGQARFEADEANGGAVTLVQRSCSAAAPNNQSFLRSCAPTSTVSACTQPCASAQTTAKRLSNCAATSGVWSGSATLLRRIGEPTLDETLVPVSVSGP
jgi:hypothetical protein